MIETCPLSSVVDVSAGQPAPKTSEFADTGTPFIRAGSLENLLNGGSLADCEKVPEANARRNGLKLYPRDTIVFAKSGMSATLGRVYRLKAPAYVVSHLAALVPTGRYDPAYLTHWLRGNPPSHLIKDPAYPSIRVSEIEDVAVPNTPLPEQRRIAAILDKADGIRRKRGDALVMADGLLKSAFLEMFGNPVSNPRRLAQKPLAECARFISGATPSKSNPAFWEGEFPWVSPKDMKVDTIHDAEDHVTESVFQQTNLKRITAGTPLIVVRGMILAHTVPMAITAREVAINQDMKAIAFDDAIDAIFGFWCLRVQHDAILGRVSTAAHGTKRLDTENLGAVPILLPDKRAQLAFVSIVRQFETLRTSVSDAVVEARDLFQSLSQRAFRGEL
ncbi:MAG: hypothetical protein E5X53_26135 [Mesorhizobium sp.]|uniref:restriction endonuclease subunit S n=1 Tax=Mesorhizobium sp. TaxID=1871066 RepID=UPI00120CF8D1|nr:restriction endonuclease subunit S [Mesorhizobium sp.]TIR49113.1 MAG: hypothetical protein E5X53_26135 [Mesorhizobium sp.]